MSVRNWNFYYNNSKDSSKKRVGDIVSLWSAIGLLWLSFFTMMTEQFPKYGMEWITILFWLACMGIAHSYVGRKPATKRYICLATDVGIPFLYIVVNFVKIRAGLEIVAENYRRLWLTYHGHHLLPGIDIPDINERAYMVVACTAILMVAWLILWRLSLLLKRPILLVLFPLGVVLLGMLVGISPKGIFGWGFLLAAVFLLLMPKGMNLMRRGFVVVAALLCFLLCGQLFADKIENLATADAKKDLFAWIGNLDFPDFNINSDNNLNMDLITTDEKLDNHTPKYTGKVILRIEGSKPTYTFYLKGFYGTDYVDGTWKKDVDSFEEACGFVGYNPTAVAKELAGLPHQLLTLTGDRTRKLYTIRYVGVVSDTVYVPYDFSPTSLDEGFTYEGDYLIQKPVTNNELEVLVHASTVSAITNPSASWVPYDYSVWYNNYAKKYAKSDTTLESIRQAALVVKQNLALDAGTMEIAKAVRSYLSANMAYSLNLDALPIGADPVDYALTVSHEGYCMHFATAGTLILRELGIPARYASGYVVVPYDFGWDATDKNYTAKVLDNAAHAWVEIYVDNVGWIPVEMTPGYDSSVVEYPTEMHPDDWGMLSDYQPETESESESESETESSDIGNTEPIEPPSPTETDSEEPSSDIEGPSERPGDSENNSDTGEPGTGPGTGGESNSWLITIIGILQWFLPVVIPIAVVLAVVYGIRLWGQHQESLLEKEIEKNYTRPAIKRMNRRIYRAIRLKNFVDIRNDEDYEKALIRTYPQVSAEDWAKYMTILKKTIYSREEISVQEMEYCHNCYLARKQERRNSGDKE